MRGRCRSAHAKGLWPVHPAARARRAVGCAGRGRASTAAAAAWKGVGAAVREMRRANTARAARVRAAPPRVPPGARPLS